MLKRRRKIGYLIGVDEAGRGPLVGPVSVAAVAVRATAAKTNKIFRGVRDSKKLSEKQREEWFKKLKDFEKTGVLKTASSFSGAKTIDEKGITAAVRRAVARVLKKLEIDSRKCQVLLDGSLRAPAYFENQETIIRGDDRIPIIAAASIIAKVSRDRRMKRYAKKFPGYGFEVHKGYGTKAHYAAIKKLGPSEIHRKSFL